MTKKLWLILAVLVVASLVLAACGGTAPAEEEMAEEEMAPTEAPPPTEEPAPPEEMAPEIGSADHPIQVLFVPSVEVSEIVAGGDVMAAALNEATGLNFEVSVPTSYAATIEAMCASPDDTIAFIPALGYVLANNRCGVEAGGAAVRRGLSWYATMYVVPIDSEAQSLADLEGATWAFPDPGSTSGFLYPSSEFGAAGVTTGDGIEAGGHPQAVLAVYNGEADVGTAFFSPPVLTTDPEWDGVKWDELMGYQVDGGPYPEPWDTMPDGFDMAETVDRSECFVDADGALLCGDWQVLDARLTVLDTAPDVMERTRILALSAKIPNDSVSFGPDFPADLRTQFIDALIAFSQTDAWGQSIGKEEFYGWSSVAPASDADYEPVRILIDQLGMTEEDILGG